VVRATEIVGRALSRGSVVVYESTVYPGVTEDLCGPLLEKVSGLKRGVDFTLGYSPERINPGDPQHSFEKITKIVSGEDSDTLERVASAYSSVVDAGVYRARSIRVAEAAKVIENTQRDLNIALMNELAIVFDRMGIRTQEVLEAAETKWNFLRFRPGLVGGHCVGVDPYYLTTKAQQLGYQPEVILAGRRINNNMGPYIAQRLVKLLVHANIPVKSARVGVLGVTFKENCMVNDPLASPRDAMHEHGVKLATLEEMERLDALVLAVSHRWYLELGQARLSRLVRDGGILVDVKSVMDPARVDRNLCYWSL
jgi:UDP-N-acetyl-D-galactosamine dehydrogenase